MRKTVKKLKEQYSTDTDERVWELNLPASKNSEPHRRISHDTAVTVTREVGEVMIRFTSSEAHKIVGIATDDPKTARSCKNELDIKSALIPNSMRTKSYESERRIK